MVCCQRFRRPLLIKTQKVNKILIESNAQNCYTADMLLNLILLFVGFVLLTCGADMFIDGASAVAKRFHIPEIVIGLTVVAFGTSLSEASVSIASVLHGANGVAVGNILGSNIANILLVLGLTATISALTIRKNTIKYEIPFVCFITLLLMWMGAYYGTITRVCAAVLLGLFVAFLIYLRAVGMKNAETTTEVKDMAGWKILLFLIIGIAFVIYSSNLIVDSSVNIARLLHVSERIIGLTIIAFGTSLPELVTCIVAVLKKRSDLAVGNIVGSNIVNILFVLGITGIIQPIQFEPAFLTDSAIALVAAVMLWVFTLPFNRLSRGAGVIFLMSYITYIAYLF